MFKDFSVAVSSTLAVMSGHELFKVDTIDIYESYLAAFPEGTNPVFRQRTEHDCNCCKQFIRNLGNVVALIDGKVVSVWDAYGALPHPYNVVGERLAALVRQAPIISVYRTKEAKLGTEKNIDNYELKGLAEESFVETRSNPRRGELENMLEIIKFVIATKQEDAAKATQRAAKASLKAQIQEAIEAKKLDQLSSASLEDLHAQLAALGE